MFDVGFSEVVVCFLVALIVLGPQKLPELARTIGRWTGRARTYMRNLSAELERETGNVGITRELSDAARALREGAGAMKDDLRKLGESAAPAAPEDPVSGGVKEPDRKP